MEKVLPIPRLEFQYAPNTDIPMRILFNNIEQYKYAFLENFIDVVTFQEKESVSIGNINIYQLTTLDCFLNSSITHEFMKMARNNLIDLYIDAINKNYYVAMMSDTYYIQQYSSYQKSHLMHQPFIYGYNTEERIFYVIDYFDFSVSKSKKILMDDISSSFFEDEVETDKIYFRFNYPSTEFLKLDYHMIRNPCLHIIKQKIINFLYNIPLNGLEYCYFGIQFIDFIVDRMVNKNYIFPRHIHFLNYHISVMELRVRMLEKEFFDQTNSNIGLIKGKLGDLKQQSRTLELVIIKNIVKDKSHNRIFEWVTMLREIKNRYYNVLIDLINEIDKKIG